MLKECEVSFRSAKNEEKLKVFTNMFVRRRRTGIMLKHEN
jgi:hypothetical protein